MCVGKILTIDGYSWVISDKPNFDHLHSLQQLNNSGIIIKESRLLQIVFYALWLSFTTDNNVNHCGYQKDLNTILWSDIVKTSKYIYCVKQALGLVVEKVDKIVNGHDG